MVLTLLVQLRQRRCSIGLKGSLWRRGLPGSVGSTFPLPMFVWSRARRSRRGGVDVVVAAPGTCDMHEVQNFDFHNKDLVLLHQLMQFHMSTWLDSP